MTKLRILCKMNDVKAELRQADVLRIAAQAQVDPRTVKAFLSGKSIRPLGAERIRDAMKALKIRTS